MISGAGKPLAANVLTGAHERECYPRCGARYKLAVQLHVNAGCITVSTVLSVVNNPYIIQVVRNQTVQFLVINLGRELERTVIHPEIIVRTQYHLHGSLSLYFFVQVDLIDATGVYRILYLLVERCLVIDSS